MDHTARRRWLLGILVIALLAGAVSARANSLAAPEFSAGPQVYSGAQPPIDSAGDLPPAAPTMDTLGILALCAILALIGATIVFRGRKDDDEKDE